jgi:ssDNA-binding replication factor A large subunit
MRLKKKDYYDLVSDLISYEEFSERISNYDKKFSNLIFEDTIAHLIVDELGRNFSNFKPISDLKIGSKASLFVMVTEPDPRLFENQKNTSQGGELFLTDHSGKARLLLWDPRHVDLVREGKMTPGTKLKLINAKISKSSYGAGLDLTVEKFESLMINPKDYPDNDEILNSLEYTNIDEIVNDGPINLTGTISWISNVRTFSRKNRDNINGHVLNLDLYDGTGKIRITLWDEHAKNAEQFNIGDHLIIINGYSKLHNNEREVQSTYRTEIVNE